MIFASTDWAPLFFSVLTPVMVGILYILGRLLFMVGRILGQVSGQLANHTERLKVLETAALTGPAKARAMRAASNAHPDDQ